MSGRFIDFFVPPGSPGLERLEQDSGRIESLAFGPDGDLFVSVTIFSGGPSEIVRYDAVTGAFVCAFVADNPDTPEDETGGLRRAINMTFGTDGNLYVFNLLILRSGVLRYDGTTGQFLDVFVGDDPATPVDESRGLRLNTFNALVMTFGADGSGDGVQDLYIPLNRNSQILRFDGVTGQFIDVFIPTSRVSNPIAVAFGPDGNLYVSARDEVLIFDGGTGAAVSSIVTGGALDLGFDPHGNLLNDSLRFDTETGKFIDVFVEPPKPESLVFGPDSNLYVVFQDGIGRLDGTTGKFLSLFVPEGSGGLENPKHLAFGPDDNLYVSAGAEVFRFDGTTGAFIDVYVSVGNGLDDAGPLIFGPDGSLYVTDLRTNRVLRFAQGTGPASLVEHLIIEPAAGDDLIEIARTTATTAVALNAGGGDDSINVGDGRISGQFGPVNVNGDEGSDVFHFRDQDGLSHSSYVVTSADLAFATGVFTYESVEQVILDVAPGASKVAVQSTTAAVTINGSAGDQVIVGNTSGLVDEIGGTVTVQGIGTLTVVDSGDTANNVGQLTRTELTGLGMLGRIILGTSEIETIEVNLGSGNDVFTVEDTGAGLVKVLAGSGDDRVTVNAPVGRFLENGELGSDTLVGGPATDILVSGPPSNPDGSDNDFLKCNGGTDLVFFTPEEDTLDQDCAIAIRLAESDLRRLNFFDPLRVDDVIFSSLGDTPIFIGTNGDDFFDATGFFFAPVVFFGLDGDDTIIVGNGPQVVLGGNGNDLIEHGFPEDEGGDLFLGGPGDDTLRGGSSDDFLEGGEGSDHIEGNDGQDILVDFGQPGPGAVDDVLDGGNGNDILAGGLGNDSLTGSEGDDTLLDGVLFNISLFAIRTGATREFLGVARAGGDDTMLGGPGNDTINGGAGNDSLDGGEGSDLIVDLQVDLVQLGADGNPVLGDFGRPVLVRTGDDANTVRRVAAISRPDLGGNDALHGGPGDDTLAGGTGSDAIFGDDGDDVLLGSVPANDFGITAGFDGDNMLDGGAGRDILIDVTDSSGRKGNRARNRFVNPDAADAVIGQLSRNTNRQLIALRRTILGPSRLERCISAPGSADVDRLLQSGVRFCDARAEALAVRPRKRRSMLSVVEVFLGNAEDLAADPDLRPGLGHFLQEVVGANPVGIAKGISRRPLPSPRETPLLVNVPDEFALDAFLRGFSGE